MFDESDIESFYFGGLSFEEASKLLATESTGTFLLRDSSSKQGFVLVVKESTDVKQYVVHCKQVGNERHHVFVREESTFPDLPALLSFYKKNLFETTALIKPISNDKVKTHHGNRHKSAILFPSLPRIPNSESSRASAPPDFDTEAFVRVCKSKTPSPYDKRALCIKVGDVIRVSKRCPSGQWEGEINGKKGVFPASHVTSMDPQ